MMQHHDQLLYNYLMRDVQPSQNTSHHIKFLSILHFSSTWVQHLLAVPASVPMYDTELESPLPTTLNWRDSKYIAVTDSILGYGVREFCHSDVTL